MRARPLGFAQRPEQDRQCAVPRRPAAKPAGEPLGQLNGASQGLPAFAPRPPPTASQMQLHQSRISRLRTMTTATAKMPSIVSPAAAAPRHQSHLGSRCCIFASPERRPSVLDRSRQPCLDIRSSRAFSRTIDASQIVTAFLGCPQTSCDLQFVQTALGDSSSPGTVGGTQQSGHPLRSASSASPNRHGIPLAERGIVSGAWSSK